MSENCSIIWPAAKKHKDFHFIDIKQQILTFKKEPEHFYWVSDINQSGVKAAINLFYMNIYQNFSKCQK